MFIAGMGFRHLCESFRKGFYRIYAYQQFQWLREFMGMHFHDVKMIGTPILRQITFHLNVYFIRILFEHEKKIEFFFLYVYWRYRLWTKNLLHAMYTDERNSWNCFIAFIVLTGGTFNFFDVSLIDPAVNKRNHKLQMIHWVNYKAIVYPLTKHFLKDDDKLWWVSWIYIFPRGEYHFD